MIPRVAPLTQIETLSGNVLASTYFDANIQPVFSAVNDSSLGQINGICTDTGSANVYQIIAANMPYGPPSALNPGFCVFFTPANSNTANANLTVGALASAPILNRAGIALQGGEINANKTLGVVYGNISPAGFRIITPTFLTLNFNNPGNPTCECAGYDAVSVYVNMTTAGSGVTLAHLGYGVPVQVTITNSSGSVRSYWISVTDPSGRAGQCWTSFPVNAGGAGPLRIDSTNVQNMNGGSEITFAGGIDQINVSGTSIAHFSP